MEIKNVTSMESQMNQKPEKYCKAGAKNSLSSMMVGTWLRIMLISPNAKVQPNAKEQVPKMKEI